MVQKIAAQNIKSVQYYPMRMALEIEFYGDSNIYQYLDVPEDIWYRMKNVFNVDMFFNSQIVSKYKCICKNEEDTEYIFE